MISLLRTTDSGTSGSNVPVWPREVFLRVLGGNAERAADALHRAESCDAGALLCRRTQSPSIQQPLRPTVACHREAYLVRTSRESKEDIRCVCFDVRAGSCQC